MAKSEDLTELARSQSRTQIGLPEGNILLSQVLQGLAESGPVVHLVLVRVGERRARLDDEARSSVDGGLPFPGALPLLPVIVGPVLDAEDGRCLGHLLLH